MRLLLITLYVGCCAQAQSADPKPLVEKAIQADGGKDKLLKIYRLKEVFHFGETPEPAAGKKRSLRDSILSQPDMWWINKKERGPDPAKDDARAWSLDLLVDESELEARRIGWAPLPPRYTRGVLAKYAKLVHSASEGAITG